MEEYLLPLRTKCAYHDPSFLPEDVADDAYRYLLENTPWEKTPKINRWVTLMELPLPSSSTSTSAMEGAVNAEGGVKGGGEEEKNENISTTTTKTSGYKYRDAPGGSIIGFPPVVHALKLRAEEWYNSKNMMGDDGRRGEKVEFDVCLLNYYEDGNMRIGWHADREEIGKCTPIASISLGCPRKFLMRSRTDGVNDRHTVIMNNGSAIFMENVCQHRYLHSVPRETEVTGGRINLTFRCRGGRRGGGSNDVVDGATTMTAGEEDHERRDNWIHNISTGGNACDTTACAWRAHGDGNGVDKIHEGGLGRKDGGGGGGGEGGGVEVFGDTAHFHETPDVVDPSSVRYVVRTNIGAECYCASEIEEALTSLQSSSSCHRVLARPFGIAGYVAVCSTIATSVHDMEEEEVEEVEEDASQMEGAFLRLRTAHHVLRYHDHFELSDVLSLATPVTTTETNNASDEEDEEKEGEEERVEKNVVGSITGEMMYEFYKSRLISGEAVISSLANLGNGGTFRTTCERIGSGHGFQAPEVER
jgi:alkylated DNA repair dioxygenase AlkB